MHNTVLIVVPILQKKDITTDPTSETDPKGLENN